MQDACVDTQLSWPDINCAARLCFDGVCKYKIKEDAGVSDKWLCQNVTPHIQSMFGEKVTAILGTSLLWACFNETIAERVHPSIRNRICGAFISLQQEGCTNGVNPVEKVELIPNEGQSGDRVEMHSFICQLPHRLSSFFSWWDNSHGRDESASRGREWWSQRHHKGESELESCGFQLVGDDDGHSDSD